MVFYKKSTPASGKTFGKSAAGRPSYVQKIINDRARKKGLVADATKPTLVPDFISDWEKLRVRHEGQKEILHAFFEQKKKYLFLRIGRKGAKTTTNIDIAWRYAFEVPRCTIFICLPTITQAIEVYWDEHRLQWCDAPDGWMEDKYIKGVDNNKHIITFINGSMIKLIGTWSDARGRGTQPNLLIVDEIQDASADYLDAVEPNLAAKADSRCVMSGTPPKKKNHYHEWEDRIKANPEGFHAEYTSYINTALPHLATWLDNKKIELIAAGKEDVWLREYMAKDCFRSDDRMMPDIALQDFDLMMQKLQTTDTSAYQPILGIVITEHHVTATFSLLLQSKFSGSQIYVLESKHFKSIFSRSFSCIYSDLKAIMETHSLVFPKKWRTLAYDDTMSFADVIPGVEAARDDKKWSKRGLPLLREMLLSSKMQCSTKASEIAVECQNFLKEDKILDYPSICAMAVVANEYFSLPTASKTEQLHWDTYAPLREAGILVPKQKTRWMREYGS